MTNYYEVSFKNKPVAFCDKVALENAGVLGEFSFGYAIPKGGDVNSEYYSVVTDRRGMGNHGKLILRGKTARARELIHEGKTRMLIAETSICRIVAEKCVCMHRGMEIEVAKFADALVDIVGYIPAAKETPVESHRQFARLVGEYIDIPDKMSLPRKCSALAIAFAAAEAVGMVVRVTYEAETKEAPRLKASIADFVSAAGR